MRLILFPASDVDTAVHQLPEPDLVVDPRPSHAQVYKFKVTVNGTTLTITRTDPPEDRHGDQTGWNMPMRFRVYNRNEDRYWYSFDSTIYIYHGLEHEKAPRDSTEVIIKDGVETIRDAAFYERESLVKVTIPDSVKRIEEYAFGRCESLRFIELPPNLEYIGEYAVHRCYLLEAVFLPPTVTEIGEGAFRGCRSLRILNIANSLEGNLQRIGMMAFHFCESLEAIFLPPTVTDIGYCAFEGCASLRILNIPDSVERIGENVINRCHSLLTDEMAKATCSYEEQIKWLRNRYNPLHNLCCQPSVTPQAITHHIKDNIHYEERSRTNDKPQFTALHLLVANPSVTGDMITAYLQLAPDVAVMQDSIGMTPLHTMLCSLSHYSDGTTTGSAIRAYLAFTEGKEAAFMMDNQGKTPFQYLCEKTFDEMPFLKEDNKSFGGLFCLWFGCLDISVFVEDADAEENTKKRKLFGGDDL